MPAWSCSTPAMPPTAAPRSGPAPRCIRRPARGRRLAARRSSTGGTGRGRTVSARALVNAAGPWVAEVVGAVAAAATPPAPIRLVKGSHIVVDRLFDHDRAYIFQNADGRVCFAIPYEQDFTLIGTTDEDFTGDPGTAAISDGGDRLPAAPRSATISASR